MGIMAQIKSDVEQITGDLTGFAQPITLTAPNGEVSVTAGIYADISIQFESDGMPMTSRDVNCSISEANILLANPDYPTRNAKGIFDFKNHLASITYADGSTVTYMVKDHFPDATLNLVNLILEKYAVA